MLILSPSVTNFRGIDALKSRQAEISHLSFRSPWPATTPSYCSAPIDAVKMVKFLFFKWIFFVALYLVVIILPSSAASLLQFGNLPCTFMTAVHFDCIFGVLFTEQEVAIKIVFCWCFVHSSHEICLAVCFGRVNLQLAHSLDCFTKE